jgi:GST-like protein
MMRLYYHPSANPNKVALFLEESGLSHEVVPIDPRKGEQFSAAYLAINPNAKAPALTDGDTTIFDSTAILLYLAEKTGLFLPPAADRGQLLSWLMFVSSGVGPFSGQAVHFKHYAPEADPYALNRYMFEAERHWGVVEARLAQQAWMVGGAYTIADMSVWGWARAIPHIFGPEAWATYPAIKRLVDAIAARPAAQRVLELPTRFAFKSGMDDEARANMFPQNRRLNSV